MDSINTALIVIGGAYVGPNADKVAKWAEVSRKKARLVGKRLRNQGMWKGHKVCVDWLDEKDIDVIALCLDISVAKGYMNRA